MAAFVAIADALAGRSTIIGPLDVRGDKPLTCLPLRKEDHPLLGFRGVRSGLERSMQVR